MEGSKVALERRDVYSFASKLDERGMGKVRRFLKGKGRRWGRKSKRNRRRVAGGEGGRKWEGKRREGVRQQFRSEGLFCEIASDACKKIRTFIKFPRSITPENGGKRKSKCMLCFSEEFLKVSTSKFTHRIHEVNDRTVVTFNDDTRWAVMWKVSRSHKNGVGSAYCFT